MIALRRFTVHFGLAVCVLYTLQHLFAYTAEIVRNQQVVLRATFGGSSSPEAQVPLTQELRFPGPGERFQWDQLPVRHPVESLTPLPTDAPLKLPSVQHDFDQDSENSARTTERKYRLSTVRSTFFRNWKSYRERAWGADELSPISGGSSDNFGGWAATLVDSLDTLWIMGYKDEFEKAVATVVEIDLTQLEGSEINVFETTIRHLGGLLAAYDLSGDARLLVKAKEFGNMLLVAFDTPNRIPITRWKPRASATGEHQSADSIVLLAEVGSLGMEFTRLSQLTGDMRWYDAIDRIANLFHEQQGQTTLPGMWPVTIDAENGDLTRDAFFTLGAMADSTYEYLAKMYALMGGVDPKYKDMYNASSVTAIENNLFRPMVPDDADILISGGVRKLGRTVPSDNDHEGQHLVCFAGGMFALGGKLFENPQHVEIGRKVTDGCIWTYKSMPMGIMPEKFKMVACDAKEECSWDELKWKQGVLDNHGGSTDADDVIAQHRLRPGFTQVSDARYVLRPEAIESVFLLYRMTGDTSLQDTAWTMFKAIDMVTKADFGNAALIDVSYSYQEVQQGQQIQMDSMESFWMAETLKYFYLIFAEPKVLHLDEWVFNTEAHPFRRALPD